MKHLIFFSLLSFYFTSCSDGKEKLLLPTKVVEGSTQYAFLYDQGKLYSITTSKPNFYGEYKYNYCYSIYAHSDHHLHKNIVRINYDPDRDVIGWDNRDSIISKDTMLERDPITKLLNKESQNIFFYRKESAVNNTAEKRRGLYQEHARHVYNANKQLSESFYYREDLGGILIKRIKYDYHKAKLAKVSFFTSNSDKPYLLIETEYDNKANYLKNIPLEARFQPLELPYRDHNIITYKVIDSNGKIRKDFSYTCSYTYNREGFPDKFTRKLLDGRKVNGYIIYKTELKEPNEIVAVK